MTSSKYFSIEPISSSFSFSNCGSFRAKFCSKSFCKLKFTSTPPSRRLIEKTNFPLIFCFSICTGKSKRGANAFLSEFSLSYHSRNPNARKSVDNPISCSAKCASPAIFSITDLSSAGNFKLCSGPSSITRPVGLSERLGSIPSD